MSFSLEGELLRLQILILKEKTMDFTTTLLDWYHREARKLPWRETKDPYKIWVSEVMLQQTQVETVIPYYKRFMERFPTLQILAAADEAEVLKYWEGLGYYRRVRLLHQGVREVQSKYGGVIPSEPELLMSLPGVGPYMVGSIASIAFNRPVAAVDGNVIRVVSRILAIDEDPSRATVRRQITAWVQERFPEGNAADYTQALMELGALVCTPKRPRCSDCPVQPFCRAAREDPERYPMKRKKADVPEERRIVLLITWKGRRLLVQRPKTGLMANFWEYPHFEAAVGDDGKRLAEEWVERNLGERLTFKFLKKMTHVYSHLRWNLEIYQADRGEGEDGSIAIGQWFLPEEEARLSRVAFVRKLAIETLD